jgi:hypothetical protein
MALQYVSLAAVIITGAAGVLAPIGLGQRVIAGNIVNATFANAADPSIFGEGTLSRLDYAISRVCGNGSFPCPEVSPLDKALSTDPTESTPMFDNLVVDNITTRF